MLSNRNKVIFVHIPKCAGTSIETLFGDITGQHKPCGWYMSHHRHQWKRCYSFSVVRNTWDWYLSLHRYWMNCSQAQWYKSKDSAKRKMRAESWYRSWVRSFYDAVLRHKFLFRSNRTGPHFWRQAAFVCRNDRIVVDYIAHLDTLARDFEEIKVEAQLPGDMRLPVINQLKDRDHHHYSAWYSDEMVQVIGEFYARDIDLFGFEFDRVEKYNPELANTPFLAALTPKVPKGCGSDQIIIPIPKESKTYGRGEMV